VIVLILATFYCANAILSVHNINLSRIFSACQQKVNSYTDQFREVPFHFILSCLKLSCRSGLCYHKCFISCRSGHCDKKMKIPRTSEMDSGRKIVCYCFVFQRLLSKIHYNHEFFYININIYFMTNLGLHLY